MGNRAITKDYPDLGRFLQAYPRDIQIPNTVGDCLVPTINVEGTTPFRALRFIAATQAAPGQRAETPAVPDDKIWCPVAVEMSHTYTSPTTMACYMGFSWLDPENDGIRTYIAITDSQVIAAGVVISRFDRPRFYLPPKGSMFAQALSAPAVGSLVIKLAYVELEIGQTLPP